MHYKLISFNFTYLFQITPDFNTYYAKDPSATKIYGRGKATDPREDLYARIFISTLGRRPIAL